MTAQLSLSLALKEFLVAATECPEPCAPHILRAWVVVYSFWFFRQAAELVELLRSAAEVTLPKQLAAVSVAQLNLPSNTSGGKVATLAETCEKAAELKQGAAERKTSAPLEDGELPATGALAQLFGAFILSLMSLCIQAQTGFAQ